MSPKRGARNQWRKEVLRAKKRAGDRRVTINCPRCHSTVGIPIDLLSNGVEFDPQKQRTTISLRGGSLEGLPFQFVPTSEADLNIITQGVGKPPRNYICEQCGYRAGSNRFVPGRVWVEKRPDP